MKCKIEFIPSSEDHFNLVDPPTLSKTNIPKWYKETLPFNQNNIFFDNNNNIKNTSLKMCIPFFDAISAGYIQKTWTDIYVSKKNNQIEYRYSTNPEIIKIRERVHTKIDLNYFYNFEFVWLEPWKIKLSKGYSAILTHPLNRNDLPFYSLSAIVDSDKYYHTNNGQYPFYIKNNFEGIIPAGTPMYQIIPFKREKFISKINKYEEKESKKNDFIMRKHFFGTYKKLFWSKKEYE